MHVNVSGKDLSRPQLVPHVRDVLQRHALPSHLLTLEIVRTILSFSRSLNKQVIAEGIETHEQLLRLKQLGTPIGQGNLLARPLGALQVQELLLAPCVAPA